MVVLMKGRRASGDTRRASGYRWRTALLALVLAASAAGDVEVQVERRIVRVSAERFAFFPSEVRLDVGEEVELHIESDDAAHGFHIAGTATNVSIPKRGQGVRVVVVRFDEPGRYPFECSRMCGAGHHFMRGEILVLERDAAGRR